MKIGLFLAPEESSLISGSTVVADGRMTGYYPVGFVDYIAVMMKKKT